MKLPHWLKLWVRYTPVIIIVLAAFPLLLDAMSVAVLRCRPLGPRFHILAVFREIVNEKQILGQPDPVRRSHYEACRTASLLLGLALNMAASALTYLLVCKRASPRKTITLALIAILAVNLLASSTAQLALVHPYKSKVNHIVEAVKAKNHIEAISLTIDFVNSSLSNSWSRPEYMLELDQAVGLLDVLIARGLGLDQAHVILYQGWGSAGSTQ